MRYKIDAEVRVGRNYLRIRHDNVTAARPIDALEWFERALREEYPNADIIHIWYDRCNN